MPHDARRKCNLYDILLTPNIFPPKPIPKMSSMSRSVSNVSIIVGIIELVAATVSALVGVVAVTSYSGHPSNSAGIWALVVSTQNVYFVVCNVWRMFGPLCTCK
jgi:hypothetical protein